MLVEKRLRDSWAANQPPFAPVFQMVNIVQVKVNNVRA